MLDALDAFVALKASSPGWQTRVNALLKNALLKNAPVKNAMRQGRV